MAPASGDGELRGSVLEVLGTLLREHRSDDVMALVEKLVARNHELERNLAELLSKRTKTREGISAAQLMLLLDGVSGPSDEERSEADAALREASEIDKAAADARAKAKKPTRRRPRLRRPIPDSLRRVDNPLPVPDQERACPNCGTERTCIDHDITEVIDLIPAEVIVRRD